MAIEEHLNRVKQGVDAWNKWRENNPNEVPDLSQADIRGYKLQKINLINANLKETKLQYANLYEANLLGANISGAIFNNSFFKIYYYGNPKKLRSELLKFGYQ